MYCRLIYRFELNIAGDENELEQFGGHAFAAGMTLEEEKLNDFRNKFELIVSNRIASEMLVPEQVVDIEIDFNELFTTGEDRVKLPKLKRILMRFEPHGPGNMKPVFLTKNVFSTDVRLLKEKHLKLSLAQPNNDVILDAIGFGLGDKIDLVAAGLPFDLLYTLEINRWKGKESLQLNIKDIRASVIAV